MIEAFYSSQDYWEALTIFTTDSYLEGMVDRQAKVQSLFPNIDYLNGDDKASSTEEEGVELIEVAETIGAVP